MAAEIAPCDANIPKDTPEITAPLMTSAATPFSMSS
jgi:hypothetical protein